MELKEVTPYQKANQNKHQKQSFSQQFYVLFHKTELSTSNTEKEQIFQQTIL